MNIIRQLVNPAILAMQAYHVPPRENLIKLDAMENPYTWPDEMIAEWQEELQQVRVNRYPDAGAEVLRKKLASIMSIPEGMDILLGNGSDELIQLVALALARPDRIFMTPEPGFAMYQVISRIVNLHYHGLALNQDDFSLQLDTALSAIERYKPALIFIAYPNNPTGNLFDRDTIESIISAAPGLVVIDEAYHAFSNDSFMDSLRNHDNLLILRTLSKSGLAGLRLGYLVGSPAWLDELNKIRLPYNINVLTQKTLEFIMDRYDLLNRQARQICSNREELFKQMLAMDGLKVWPSNANFLLFRCQNRIAADIHAGLKQKGVLIKNLHASQPGLDQCLRVTVGTPEENRQFINVLAKLL